MVRRFTKANTNFIAFEASASSTETFADVTVAAVVRRMGESGIDGGTLITLETSGGSTVGELAMETGGPYKLAFHTHGAVSKSTFDCRVADNWMLLAANRGTGTVTPRVHKYVYATNTWTHQAGDATHGDGPGGGANAVWRVGRFETSAGEILDGILAAVAVFPHEFTDSEIERLPRGDWWRFSPKFHVEFPPTDSTVVAQQLGRTVGKQSATNGTWVAETEAGPPGFRYSILNRRR